MFHDDALYKFTFYLLTFTYLLMLARKLAALASHGQVRPVEFELYSRRISTIFILKQA